PRVRAGRARRDRAGGGTPYGRGADGPRPPAAGGAGRARRPVIASTSHYFSPAPPVASGGRVVEYRDRGRAFRFHTAAGVFARRGVDRGSRLLLETVEPSAAQRILDLGCGYGVLGIVMAARAPQARVVLVDVNPRAVELARENTTLNHVDHVDVRCGD